MKKLYTILTMLMLFVSGAWATESTICLGSSATIKSNGTFYNSNNEVVTSSNWWPKVVVSPVSLSGCVSSYSGYIDVGTTYGNQTLTITVPSGITIKSYTIGLKLTGSTTACTAGEVALSSSESKTVSASNINAQSTSISFSNITEDSNHECIIAITDLTIVVDGIAEMFTREINAANGTFYSGTTPKVYSGSQLFANKWLSTAENPQITFYRGDTPGSGSNNIIIDDNFRIHSDTYHISVPDRYRIKGYVITGYTGSSKAYTITPDGQTAKSISTDSSKPTTVYVDGLFTNNASFTVGGSSTGTPWVYITSFRVAVEDLVTRTNLVLDELANISAYSSAATSAKTAIASATSQAEIEAAVNSALNIQVSFKNKLTTTAYLTTTGANITGTSFSSDAAWKLVNYNAATATFKVYNEAHEAYIASLPSADYTPATATTNSSNAGNWTITSSDGYLLFTMPSVNSSHSALHYSNGNAVRWTTDADASKWTVEKVYSITYNHYKVADASNPSTTGATLIATSTNYYISGTNITYDAPLTGLSPVTSLNTQPSDGAISSDVVIDYYYEQDATLPFTTSTITNGELDNPTWYYVQINGLATYASGDRMVVDGSKTGLNYERWCFVGDAIYGVQIFAESKGVAYPLNIASMSNNDNVRISSASTNTHWYVSGSDLSNLTFYQKSGNNTYSLNQLGGTSGGGSWSWKIGLWSSGSKVELSPAASNMPNDWASEIIDYIPTQDVWTNMGTIGWPSSTARGTLQGAMQTFGQSTSYANYSALLNAWNTYKTTTDITTPSANTFWRINSIMGANASLQSANGGARMKFSTTKDKETIFLYDGTHLISYSKGLSVNNVREMGNVGIAGNGFTFVKALSGNMGQVSVMCTDGGTYNNNYLYSTGVNDSNADRNTRATTFDNNNSFTLEPINSLPVTMNAVGTDYYATLCMPVDVTITGATAYTLAVAGSGDNIYLTPTAVKDNKVPAGTPVMLKGTNETATATVNTGEAFNGGSPLTCVLTGTYAAINVSSTNDTDYFLGKYNDEVGFYHWSGTVLKGFRAYLDADDLSGAGANGFSIVWDETTGISGLTPALSEGEGAVYDLQGRRLGQWSAVNGQLPRGIYVVNGKKVVVK